MALHTHTHNGCFSRKTLLLLSKNTERICRGLSPLFALKASENARESKSIRICCRMQMLDDRNDSNRNEISFYRACVLLCAPT